MGKKNQTTRKTKRTEEVPVIEERYTWNLTDIYSDENNWETEYRETEQMLALYSGWAGQLGSSAELLAQCLKHDEAVGTKLERLSLYAMLARDKDLRESKYLSMHSRIKSLYAQAGAASAYIRPELLEIPEEVMNKFIAESESLTVYRHYLADLQRSRNHTLSRREEELLAAAGEAASLSYDVFSVFSNAELPFPVTKDETGKPYQISHGRYSAALYSNDRAFRERVYKGFYKPFTEHPETFTTLFNGNLKEKIFFARARNYSSALEASLHPNNIPISVYDNLITQVNENLAPMHRWTALKAKALGLEKIHPYDMYTSVLGSLPESNVSYDAGVLLVRQSLERMGSEYLTALDNAFANRWIDVYETKGKRSGAYSSGTTFGVHPYVLLNWTNLLNDVFTLAHEMGHNMHSYFTGQHQPFVYANYTIFVAEVASTFNEALLFDHLLSKTTSAAERLGLLEKYLNDVTATFFRQAMFAEFERAAYQRTEHGEALNSTQLRELYSGLYAKYNGPAMEVDHEEEFTWARVPHFYYNFYVYQYATGFAASQLLAEKVLRGEPRAVDNYLTFLKSGASDYSIALLQKAGVDMNSSEPVLAVSRKMNEVLDEAEYLLQRQ